MGDWGIGELGLDYFPNSLHPYLPKREVLPPQPPKSGGRTIESPPSLGDLGS